MDLKSKKGYSLIEIGVGLLILTVFLVCSVAVFNGSYNHYRMIQQRNLAIDHAVSNMEELLQTDSDILAGFFMEELDTTTNKYILKANPEFGTYVKNNFNDKFKERYARLNFLNVDAVDSLTEEEYAEYIYEDKDFLINSYIENIVNNYSDAEFTAEEVQNGNYALLVPSVTEIGNERLLSPGSEGTEEINGEMAIRRTILRLPLTEEKAYGNKILKVKVEVLYTNKVNTSHLTNDDIYTITLESIKIAN